MGNFFKKVQENFNKEGNQKKKIENLVFFLILLIVVVVAINLILNPKKEENTVINSEKQFVSKDTDTVVLAEQDVTNIHNQEYILKNDLEKILSKIEGAGNVKVMITYTESSETKAMYNQNTKESTTEETDSSGGVRTISQTDSSKEIVYTEESGKKVPITEKVIMPKIEGAIILAEGAGDANIKNDIILAVEAVTGLSTHKIQVFKLGNA